MQSSLKGLSFCILQSASLNNNQINQDCQLSKYFQRVGRSWQCQKIAICILKTFLTNWISCLSSRDILWAAVFGVPIFKDVHESHSHQVGCKSFADVNGGPPHFLSFEEKHAGRSLFAWEKHICLCCSESVIKIRHVQCLAMALMPHSTFPHFVTLQQQSSLYLFVSLCDRARQSRA